MLIIRFCGALAQILRVNSDSPDLQTLNERFKVFSTPFRDNMLDIEAETVAI